jgi:hypothetical protein
MGVVVVSVAGVLLAFGLLDLAVATEERHIRAFFRFRKR